MPHARAWHGARASYSEETGKKAPVVLEMKPVIKMIAEETDDRKLGRKVDHRPPSPAPVKDAAPSPPARPKGPPSGRLQRSGDQLKSRLYSRLGLIKLETCSPLWVAFLQLSCCPADDFSAF